jgi:hypothetical protein
MHSALSSGSALASASTARWTSGASCNQCPLAQTSQRHRSVEQAHGLRRRLNHRWIQGGAQEANGGIGVVGQTHAGLPGQLHGSCIFRCSGRTI